MVPRMSRKLTIGFIGLGGIARVHTQALRELGHKVDFCATVSSSESRLREFSEAFQCKGYMNYIEMLRCRLQGYKDSRETGPQKHK
jgi:predicted dehydrogenase